MPAQALPNYKKIRQEAEPPRCPQLYIALRTRDGTYTFDITYLVPTSGMSVKEITILVDMLGLDPFSIIIARLNWITNWENNKSPNITMIQRGVANFNVIVIILYVGSFPNKDYSVVRG